MRASNRNTEVKPFLDLLKGMLSRREFHYPLVSAQYQFRERYYGLASAAMLEDLFFDALSHFISAFQPTSILTRPVRGEKGYDYEFDDLRISHKVSKEGPIEIAALWDATVKNINSWTFPTPVALTNSNYKPKTFDIEVVHFSDQQLNRSEILKIRSCATRPDLKRGEQVALVHWSNAGEIEIKEIFDIQHDGHVRELVPFEDIWKKVVVLEINGIPANEIELLVFPTSSQIEKATKLIVQNLETVYRPGIYVLALDQLTDVPIIANNRAQLVPRAYVAKLMTECFSRQQFVPMSNWFMSYSGNNPPDLYIAQKQNFDLFFSRQNVGVSSDNSRKRNLGQ